MSIMWFAMLMASPISQDAAAPAPADAPDAEKKICRREQVTGSIMPSGRKLCFTRADWARIDAERSARRDRDLDGRGRVSMGGVQ